MTVFEFATTSVPISNPIVGTIATITRTVAAAGVSVEVITVGETDYFLVPANALEEVVKSLRRAGHTVREKVRDSATAGAMQRS